MEAARLLFPVMLVLVVYFLPTIMAKVNGHRQVVAIGALNALLGWTVLGWIAAFVWMCVNTRERRH